MKTLNFTMLVSVLLLAIAATSYAGITEQVNVTSDGYAVNSADRSEISFDGRHVVFRGRELTSDCPGRGIYVHDRETDNTVCASVNNDGVSANNTSFLDPAISGNGEVTAFFSRSTNLAAPCTFGYNIFVRDLKNGVTECASVNNEGEEGNSRSWFRPALDYEGRYVAFYSQASNLVPGDTNGRGDIFVRDRVNGTTERVSVDSDGNQANNASHRYPAISGDGRYVAFASLATNLVTTPTNGVYRQIYVHDRVSGETVIASVDSNGNPANSIGIIPDLSDDGMRIVFTSGADNLVPGDTNGTSDVFLHDRATGETTRVSVNPSGGQFNTNCSDASISADGRYIAFSTFLSVVYVHDTLTGITQLASVNSDGVPANARAFDADISRDGTAIAFSSAATNLDPRSVQGGGLNVFAHDFEAENNPPSANAGPDITVECASPQGTSVTLDGSGSTDPDGDDLIYTWTGPFGIATGETITVTFPYGTHTVTLTVDDGNGGTDSDTTSVTVEDTTPPEITIFGISDGETYALGLVPEAYYDVTDTCSGVASSSAMLMGGSLGLGTFTYTVTATDNAGNTGTETATYEVIATEEGLIALIYQMVEDGLISSQMATPLISKLENGAVAAFINQVEAQTGKKIDSGAAAILINAANYLLNN